MRNITMNNIVRKLISKLKLLINDVYAKRLQYIIRKPKKWKSVYTDIIVHRCRFTTVSLTPSVIQ